MRGIYILLLVSLSAILIGRSSAAHYRFLPHPAAASQILNHLAQMIASLAAAALPGRPSPRLMIATILFMFAAYLLRLIFRRR